MPCHSTWERHQGGQEAEDRRGGHLGHGLHWVSMGKARQGEQLRTSQFESFQWALTLDTVSSCLVPGPGMIKERNMVFRSIGRERNAAPCWLVCISKACSCLQPPGHPGVFPMWPCVACCACCL